MNPSDDRPSTALPPAVATNPLAQLPHLLMLLDDPSESVQAAVLDALAAFGPELAGHLSEMADPPNGTRRDEIVAQVSDHLVVTTRGHFMPGQLVRHQRYGYRGVVVAADPTCMADESWYSGNRTQPDREQPWYHVLVDNSTQVTYAAHSSLEADPSSEPVDHPFIAHFFDGFDDGVYHRNSQPWPGHSN